MQITILNTVFFVELFYGVLCVPLMPGETVMNILGHKGSSTDQDTLNIVEETVYLDLPQSSSAKHIDSAPGLLKTVVKSQLIDDITLAKVPQSRTIATIDRSDHEESHILRADNQLPKNVLVVTSDDNDGVSSHANKLQYEAVSAHSASQPNVALKGSQMPSEIAESPNASKVADGSVPSKTKVSSDSEKVAVDLPAVAPVAAIYIGSEHSEHDLKQPSIAIPSSESRESALDIAPAPVSDFIATSPSPSHEAATTSAILLITTFPPMNEIIDRTPTEDCVDSSSSSNNESKRGAHSDNLDDQSRTVISDQVNHSDELNPTKSVSEIFEAFRDHDDSSIETHESDTGIVVNRQIEAAPKVVPDSSKLTELKDVSSGKIVDPLQASSRHSDVQKAVLTDTLKSQDDAVIFEEVKSFDEKEHTNEFLHKYIKDDKDSEGAVESIDVMPSYPADSNKYHPQVIAESSLSKCCLNKAAHGYRGSSSNPSSAQDNSDQEFENDSKKKETPGKISDDKGLALKPNVLWSFWEKLIAGIKCSQRDCEEAFHQIPKRRRPLLEPSMIRRARTHLDDQ